MGLLLAQAAEVPQFVEAGTSPGWLIAAVAGAVVLLLLLAAAGYLVYLDSDYWV
ncbi:MAG TPA: hypothetical protein VMF30_18425 [Pirellulales bacterium]|nr:hypothetical protein [Pirellulales bacterium]